MSRKLSEEEQYNIADILLDDENIVKKAGKMGWNALLSSIGTGKKYQFEFEAEAIEYFDHR